MLSLKEAVAQSAPTKNMTRRLVIWTWRGLGTGDAEENAALECFRQWQYRTTPEDPNRTDLQKILWYEAGGTALGVLQVKALVQWPGFGRVMRQVRLFTDLLRVKANYDGGEPVVDHVRLRHGGSGDKRWHLEPH